MDSLPHRAQKSNPQEHATVYALTEPVEQFAWTHVRYIGISTNVQYRYQQHLACREADSNEDKDEWIQGLLRQGKRPMLYEIETVEVQQSRQREQYWIRYAISQGAKILNRAITSTEKERTERQAQRAIQYAKIASLLAQGTYVKRWDGGHWYPPRLLDRYSVPNEQHISLVKTLTVGIKRQDDSIVSIHDASDEEFDAFIRPHLPIFTRGSTEWTLEERRDVIEYAMSWGKELALYDLPKPEKKQRRKRGK